MVSELGEAEDEIFKRRRDTDVSATELVISRTQQFDADGIEYFCDSYFRSQESNMLLNSAPHREPVVVLQGAQYSYIVIYFNCNSYIFKTFPAFS